MQDSNIQGHVKSYVGEADICGAFEDEEIKFQDFVEWAFNKNMVIKYEKEKERLASLEFNEDTAEVES